MSFKPPTELDILHMITLGYNKANRMYFGDELAKFLTTCSDETMDHVVRTLRNMSRDAMR